MKYIFLILGQDLCGSINFEQALKLLVWICPIVLRFESCTELEFIFISYYIGCVKVLRS